MSLDRAAIIAELYALGIEIESEGSREAAAIAACLYSTALAITEEAEIPLAGHLLGLEFKEMVQGEPRLTGSSEAGTRQTQGH